MFQRAVTIPRLFESKKIGDGARRAEQHPAKDSEVEIIRRTLDAFHTETVNRIFGNEQCRSDCGRNHDVNVSLFTFETDVAD